MRKILAGLAGIVAAGSLIAAPATPAGAAGCTGMFWGTVINVADAAYVDIRELASGDYLWSIWVYLEDNGQAGLQRGGWDILSQYEDDCNDGSPNGPDQLIY